MDLNKVMLIGRLTADPEARTTPQGITVTSFSVATNRTWKDQQGNRQDKTEYHNIVTWRKLAEICAQYLTKGKQIYLEGHLQTRTWEGQDGKKNYRTEVIADNMIMLGSRGDSGSAPATTSTTIPAATPGPAAVMTESKPVEEPAPASISDEEIRIEDIPF